MNSGDHVILFIFQPHQQHIVLRLCTFVTMLFFSCLFGLLCTATKHCSAILTYLTSVRYL